MYVHICAWAETSSRLGRTASWSACWTVTCQPLPLYYYYYALARITSPPSRGERRSIRASTPRSTQAFYYASRLPSPLLPPCIERIRMRFLGGGKPMMRRTMRIRRLLSLFLFASILQPRDASVPWILANNFIQLLPRVCVFHGNKEDWSRGWDDVGGWTDCKMYISREGIGKDGEDNVSSIIVWRSVVKFGMERTTWLENA